MADLSIELDQKLEGTPAYRDLRLVDGQDLVLTNDADVRGTDAIAQFVTQRLRFLAGEWFMNVGLGIPYLEELLGRRGEVAAFEALLQNTVLTTPGILSLLTWNTVYSRAQRVLTVSFQAQATTGIVSFSGNLDPSAGSQP